MSIAGSSFASRQSGATTASFPAAPPESRRNGAVQLDLMLHSPRVDHQDVTVDTLAKTLVFILLFRDRFERTCPLIASVSQRFKSGKRPGRKQVVTPLRFLLHPVSKAWDFARCLITLTSSEPFAEIFFSSGLAEERVVPSFPNRVPSHDITASVLTRQTPPSRDSSKNRLRLAGKNRNTAITTSRSTPQRCGSRGASRKTTLANC